ncbi:hypothetical protein F2Q68_00038660 [Brassica cretica]|uniref:Uncharacterized protein n=1 Tax=Brassica cretica TaxID=69181 RepID=A0A8S9MHQ4_BRACR|nr:hypothetical protein F2Q68_00038660 [Brassica cretica]
MEGSLYPKFSFSRRKGVVPGTGPGILFSGDPGHLLAGTQRSVSCLGSGRILYLRLQLAVLEALWCWGKIFHEDITPASGFQLPASRFLPPGPEFLPPGLGPFARVWVPVSSLRLPGRSSQFHSRQGKVPYLEDLLLRHAYDRLTPVVTTDQGKIYAHCVGVKIGHDGIDVRISVKTSKAETTNSRNRSPGELDHDTSQLAQRARTCCRSTRRRARRRHEPAHPASTTVLPVDSPASSAAARASSPASLLLD